MNTGITGTPETIRAEKVPDERRLDTLPRHFGCHMLAVEEGIYAFMRELSPDYEGGYWHFYELSNGGFYMAPDGTRFRIRVKGNGYEGLMSADAAGITACLFAYSHLSFEIRNDLLSRHFYQLRGFALAHAEAAEIVAAID